MTPVDSKLLRRPRLVRLAVVREMALRSVPAVASQVVVAIARPLALRQTGRIDLDRSPVRTGSGWQGGSRRTGAWAAAGTWWTQSWQARGDDDDRSGNSNMPISLGHLLMIVLFVGIVLGWIARGVITWFLNVIELGTTVR